MWCFGSVHWCGCEGPGECKGEVWGVENVDVGRAAVECEDSVRGGGVRVWACDELWVSWNEPIINTQSEHWVKVQVTSENQK